MKCLLIGIVMLLGIQQSMIAQKPLSRAAVNDFANNLFYQFKYGTPFIRQQLNYSLSKEGYEYEYAVTVVENAGKSNEYREVMLKCIYSTFKSRKDIFNFLYSLELTAPNATEIADYTYQKYSNEEQLEQAKKATDAAIAKRKYEIEHAGEIKIADSLKKVKDAEDVRNELLKQEAARKEVFLNEMPDISTVVGLFDKSQDEVLNYLSSKGYVQLKKVKEAEIYIKSGALNDSLPVAISFKKSKLQSFTFRTKANNKKENDIVDTLERKLGFVSNGLGGSVLRDAKGNYTGTSREAKNKENGIKCLMVTSSYTQEYMLQVSLYKK